MEMFAIMILAAVEVVLLMVFCIARTVLKERSRQRIQHEQAAAYFAARDQRHAMIEAAAREAALRGVDQRAR
jgi:hypothetical protein